MGTEGAEGVVVVGTTALLWLDAGPDPLELVAVTVKVYDVPLFKPGTVIGLL